MSDRPNILLLVVDCLRADHVYEEGLAHIPAIRALMGRGFSFQNAIASTTTTTPSFASLLTGRYPFEHGVRTHHGGKLSEGVPMMPQLLQQAGYHTYAEACGPLGVEVGMDRGFDEYVHRGRRAVITGAWGKELLDRLDGHYREPWFLMLHVWALHKPRQVLPERSGQDAGRTEYARALSSIDLKLGPILEALAPQTAVIFTGDHGEEIPTGWLDARIRRIRKQVFLFRKRHGLTKTHISIGSRDCSDGHGFAIYEPLVRVPLILAHEGRIPAGRSDVQVRHIDVAPTVLELAGLPVPEEMTGRGLMAAVGGEDTAHRDAYLEAVGSGLGTTNAWLAGIRVDNRYKYIYAPFYELFTPELYDLTADPDERRNIAAEQPEVVADLLSRIGAIQDRARAAGVPLSEEEQSTVMERLKDLGYLDE
jgi:arylsulfatase A-like enzyme